MIQPGIVERAFELAKGGTCTSLEDIRRQLKREGYVSIDHHLCGVSIRKQLRAIMKV